MEKNDLLGEGTQYYVYSSGQSVVKVPKNIDQIKAYLAKKHLSRYANNPNLLSAHAYYYHTLRNYSVQTLKKRGFKKIIGGAKYIEGGKILQDRIIPFSKQFFKRHKSDVLKEMLKRWFLSLKTYWSLGFSEISFGLDKYGLSPYGKVILFDFGELSFDSWEIRSCLSRGDWLMNNDYILNSDLALRKWFIKEFEKILEKSWKIQFKGSFYG